MRKFRLWASLILVVALIGAGGWAYWNYELRWRPKTITKHQAEIAKILQSAGWVAPGNSGPKLYMVSYRTCTDCIRLEKEEFPKFHAAGVDTRVIVIARADKNGVERSTPAERATVAELWANRKWALLERWSEGNPDLWKADGIVPADGDLGRTALVEAGRKLVDDLTPLMKSNGVTFAYPLLVWWDKDGVMHGCACESEKTYRFLRKELGVG
jgi:hypothetical protein